MTRLFGFGFSVSLSVSMGLAAAACGEAGDIAAKALDANEAQPGEADARIVTLGSITTRTAAITGDDKEYFVVTQNGDMLKRAHDAGDFTKIGSVGRTTESFGYVHLLLDADTIWYCDGVGVVRMPRAGGAPEDMNIKSFSNDGFVQNATSLFVSNSGSSAMQRIDKATKTATALPTVYKTITAFAADGDRLVVADLNGNTVTSVAMSGDGEDKVLAKDQAGPRTVNAAGGYVYWSNGSIGDDAAITDRMFRTKSDGTGTAEVVAKFDATFPNPPIAIDETNLYYSQNIGGLWRVPIAGGTPTKFLNFALRDYYSSGGALVVLEDNSLRTVQTDKDKPNRVATVTK